METEPQWLHPLEREQLLLSLFPLLSLDLGWLLWSLQWVFFSRCYSSAGSSGAVRTLLVCLGGVWLLKMERLEDLDGDVLLLGDL